MSDKLRPDPLTNSTLLLGIKFPESVVMHKGDTIWIEVKTHFDRGGNGGGIRVIGPITDREAVDDQKKTE